MVVQRLFKEGLIVPVYRAAGRRVSVDEMERRALVDPGFGGHLVSWFSSAGERLPDFITQPALVGAHQFLLEPGRPNADVKVALAYAINLPGSEPQRDLVRAILLCDGATLESTAALLQVDAEVVSLFEALHWNVLDRKRERHYVGCAVSSGWGAPLEAFRPVTLMAWCFGGSHMNLAHPRPC